MQIADFKEKLIPGLYAFRHFQHENGAFIQASYSTPVYWVFQDADGVRSEHHSIESLKSAVEKQNDDCVME